MTTATVPLAPHTWIELSYEALHGAATIHETSKITYVVNRIPFKVLNFPITYLLKHKTWDLSWTICNSLRRWSCLEERLFLQSKNRMFRDNSKNFTLSNLGLARLPQNGLYNQTSFSSVITSVYFTTVQKMRTAECRAVISNSFKQLVHLGKSCTENLIHCLNYLFLKDSSEYCKILHKLTITSTTTWI